MTFRLWALFLIVVAAVGLALEVYALRTGTPTLSQLVWAVHDRAPWISHVAAFGAGFLGGHWFWPRRK